MPDNSEQYPETTVDEVVAALAEGSSLDREELILALRRAADLLEQLDTEPPETPDLGDSKVRQSLVASVQELPEQGLPTRRDPNQLDPSVHPSAYVPEGSRVPVEPELLSKVRNKLMNAEVTKRLLDPDAPEPPTVA